MTNRIKIQQIAIGTHELSVSLLDSNGRLWYAIQNIGHGGVVAGWVNDKEAGAVSLSIDGAGTTWVVNSDGKIFSKIALTELGQKIPEWTEDSLKDTKGNFVKATQISTGDHYYQAIDVHNRLWARTLPHPGAGVGITDSSWLLDRSVANVKIVEAGYRLEDLYHINDSGQLYRMQKKDVLSSGWRHQETFQGTSKKMASVKHDNLSNVVSLKVAQVEPTEFWQSSLFYLTKDGHIHQPSGLRVHSGSVYFEDSVGIGVDFAVINVNDIWMVNAQGDIYHRTKDRNPDALLMEGKPIPVTVQGDQYYWSKIKGPDFKEARIYWVQPGDTFNQIAADFGIAPGVLKDRNKQVANVNHIKAGDRLAFA